MLRRIDQKTMGSSDLGWLKSKFHFSFAEYRNPGNINFGVLRVINDDLVKAGTGFGTHPHRDMEIVSYVVDGELSHKDSMGNERSVSRGNIQYLSAGTGITHSEYNHGDETIRFLQIWIFPDANGHNPNYGDHDFPWEDRVNQWLHMVSPVGGKAPVHIHQDANIYSLALDAEKEIDFTVAPGRQAYLVQIEGQSKINDIEMLTRDGMEIIEEDILIQAQEDSHILVIEMAKS